MTEEEKKAIEKITKVRDKNLHTFVDELTTILNLIQKQQAELEKKDKIIDEMANKIYEEGIVWENKEEVKQYFEEKANEEVQNEQ